MSAPFAFEASTPADAQTKPCRVSAMTSGGRERTTSRASLRITSRRRGSASPASSRARSDGSTVDEVDDAALDLRDRLLRDDEHVVVLEAACACRGVEEQPCQVVALVELGQPPQRDDAELAGQSRPVTRMPAWPL